MNGRAHTVSPYRVALEQSHEALMAAVRRPPTSHESSVTMTRNARGVVQFEVTVRADLPGDAMEHAVAIFETLAGEYPYPAVNGGTE